MKTIHETLNKSRQAWKYAAIFQPKTVKYRVEIYRDAYDAQSYAEVCYWKGEWIKVMPRLPITECPTVMPISYVDENVDQDRFESDAISLVEIAMKIVE